LEEVPDALALSFQSQVDAIAARVHEALDCGVTDIESKSAATFVFGSGGLLGEQRSKKASKKARRKGARKQKGERAFVWFVSSMSVCIVYHLQKSPLHIQIQIKTLLEVTLRLRG
jgi:hypothetical protein